MVLYSVLFVHNHIYLCLGHAFNSALFLRLGTVLVQQTTSCLINYKRVCLNSVSLPPNRAAGFLVGVGPSSDKPTRDISLMDGLCRIHATLANKPLCTLKSVRHISALMGG